MLVVRLKKRFRRVAEDEVMQAAADAMLNYIERPERFDPTRLALAAYLTMSAQGDLLNAIAKHRVRGRGPVQCPACGKGQLVKLPGVCPACRTAIPRGTEPSRRRDVRFEAVAESDLGRNTWREPSPAEAVEQSETRRGAGELMQEVLEVITDPRDRELMRLILAGERKTAAYGALLGLERLDLVQQRRIVKQHKDRLTQRLRRLRKKRND
jgi:RNA polymerase sigma-70 factor (ECF subfamily)